MRWALALFLACELAAFVLLAREGVHALERSSQGWNLPQWLMVLGLAALCAWLSCQWPALWRGAACTYCGLAQGRDSTGRPAISIGLPDGRRAVARVESSWELGELALVLALEPVSGHAPRVLLVNRACADADALRLLRRRLRVARRERLGTGDAN